MGNVLDSVGIGIIGCGNISSAYLTAARLFPVLDVRAVADLDPAAARRRGEEFGVPATGIGEILADPGTEIVINLTIPNAHAAVSRDIVAAGKHAYSEKPLAVSFAEAKALAGEAERRGVRLGCAPDTFLGGAHQAAREFLDAGRLGEVVGGTAFFMCPGHERWHPNPDFYYKAGGGPVLDMAPYYLTLLVNLLGPVARVAAMAPTPRPERTITSAPRAGETIAVEVPTHVGGTLAFASGAVVGITMSFDVAGHRHLPLEVYGTEGSLIVPDPNWFGGEVSFMAKGGEWEEVPVGRPWTEGQLRSIGVADMAAAIRQGRPHRASGALALHVLEVMEGLARSAETGAFVEIATRPERPRPLAEDPAARPAEREDVMKQALIAWGGWDGHEPEAGAARVGAILAEEGFEVVTRAGTAAFADPDLGRFRLIVPILTMSTIGKEELANLLGAVQGGVGLGGYHGGMADAFRGEPEYQFMVGGQWVAHPGNVIDYHVDVTRPDDPVMAGIRARFPYRSEQYYLHVDPRVEVLATTTFSGAHAEWIAGAVVPQVWKTRYGRGRVFFSALGHVAAEFDVPEMATILRRGLVWAAA